MIEHLHPLEREALPWSSLAQIYIYEEQAGSIEGSSMRNETMEKLGQEGVLIPRQSGGIEYGSVTQTSQHSHAHISDIESEHTSIIGVIWCVISKPGTQETLTAATRVSI